MSSGAPTISMADFNKLQAAGKTRIPGEKKPKVKRKTDYATLCLLPQWKVKNVYGNGEYTLPMPPSANKYWRHIIIKGRATVLVSQEARDYKREVGKLAKRLGMPLLTGKVQLTIQMHRGQKKGDLSNRIKVIEDALKGVAYHDDEQVVQINASRFESPGNPHIVISIVEVGK